MMRTTIALLLICTTAQAATPYRANSYPVDLTISDEEGFSVSVPGVFNTLEIVPDSWSTSISSPLRWEGLVDGWYYEFLLDGFFDGERSMSHAEANRILIRRNGGVPAGTIAEQIRIIGSIVEFPPDAFTLTPINERQAEFRLPFEWQFEMPSELRTFTYTLRGDSTVIATRFLIPEPAAWWSIASALLITLRRMRREPSRTRRASTARETA